MDPLHGASRNSKRENVENLREGFHGLGLEVEHIISLAGTQSCGAPLLQGKLGNVVYLVAQEEKKMSFSEHLAVCHMTMLYWLLYI